MLNSSALMEAGVASGSAALAAEVHRHNANDAKVLRARLDMYPHSCGDLWVLGCRSHANFITPCLSPSHQGKLLQSNATYLLYGQRTGTPVRSRIICGRSIELIVILVLLFVMYMFTAM